MTAEGPHGGKPDSATERSAVLPGLRAAAARLARHGVAVPELGGKLIRPLLALGLVPPELRPSLDHRFWSGALAVQMAHEASLLHDDIVDGAEQRRGRETEVARNGVACALIRGDHFLTGAYRAAAESNLPLFLQVFIESVERTVAGEVEQGRRVGTRLDGPTYEEMVAAKSGSLFGAGAALGAAVLDRPKELEDRRRLGAELGTLYQMVDDFLDYCPGARAGKPPLQDYRQSKWTWVMDATGTERFGDPEEELLHRLFHRCRSGRSPMGGALEHLRSRGAAVVTRAGALSPGDSMVGRVVDGWMRAAEEGVAREEERRSRSAPALEAV
jgi:octaprenyl-diphosphate synthase